MQSSSPTPLVPTPPVPTPFDSGPHPHYLIYDIESNGINPLSAAIMQIFVIDGMMMQTHAQPHAYAKPNVVLNRHVWPHDGVIAGIAIHHIDATVLAEKKAVSVTRMCEELVTAVRKRCGRNPVVFIAYNNFGYDQVVLEANFKAGGIRMPDHWQFMDIFPLVQAKYIVEPNYKLESIYRAILDAISRDCAPASGTDVDARIIALKRETDNFANQHIDFHTADADVICLRIIFQYCAIKWVGDFAQHTRPKLTGGAMFRLPVCKLDCQLSFYPVCKIFPDAPAGAIPLPQPQNRNRAWQTDTVAHLYRAAMRVLRSNVDPASNDVMSPVQFRTKMMDLIELKYAVTPHYAAKIASVLYEMYILSA